MSYQEALKVAGTRADFNRMMLGFDIVGTVLVSLFLIGLGVFICLLIREARRPPDGGREDEPITLHSFGSDHYRPTITGEVEESHGTVWVRMGPPEETRR